MIISKSTNESKNKPVWNLRHTTLLFFVLEVIIHTWNSKKYITKVNWKCAKLITTFQVGEKHWFIEWGGDYLEPAARL
jgi:hypothetical protein